jgi:AbrB family looped-hinge helix DNA binding protein
MAKVTSKRQVTVPKALADRYGIEPGSELEWQAAGEVIRVIPPGRRPGASSVEARLALFDAATDRQRARQQERTGEQRKSADRGWARDDLYDRRGLRRS